jgi:predicted ABC-type exoprotein transport system permease subunit
VFDFHHAELVLSISVITVKPTTIKEDYFKFLIPDKTKLKDFINDPIIVSFLCPSTSIVLITTLLVVVAVSDEEF